MQGLGRRQDHDGFGQKPKVPWMLRPMHFVDHGRRGGGVHGRRTFRQQRALERADLAAAAPVRDSEPGSMQIMKQCGCGGAATLKQRGGGGAATLPNTYFRRIRRTMKQP